MCLTFLFGLIWNNLGLLDIDFCFFTQIRKVLLIISSNNFSGPFSLLPSGTFVTCVILFDIAPEVTNVFLHFQILSSILLPFLLPITLSSRLIDLCFYLIYLFLFEPLTVFFSVHYDFLVHFLIFYVSLLKL